MYKLLKQDLSTNVKKLKNFVLSNLYDLTNDKNEGILLKEKFYDENYDEPNIWIPREIAKACARKRHNNVKR